MSTKRGTYNNLKWHQRIAFNLLWGFCLMIGYSPRWFRFYILQSFIEALLRLIGYRRKVVMRNLTASFAEKTERERRHIMHRFYNTLAEVIVDTMALAGTNPKRDAGIMSYEDAEGHIERNKGRDWIAMASHFGCWEYFPLWGWVDKKCEFISVYHPLKSSVFEHFYRRLRKFSSNITTVTMAEAVRYYIRNRSKEHTTVLGLISDQSPALGADTEWIDFLCQPTAFIDGSEKLAMRFGIPVYFCHVERIARGRYNMRFEEIYDGKESVEPNEITRRYAERLQKMIRQQPELWMWSHKRWKHTPEKQLQIFGKSTLK